MSEVNVEQLGMGPFNGKEIFSLKHKHDENVADLQYSSKKIATIT